jgi:flagellar biosynthesis protein FlhG
LVEHRADQAAGLRRMFSAACSRVIEVAAGHTGVGRSTLAANLAAALGRSGGATLLVDVVPAAGASRAVRWLDAAAGGLPGAATEERLVASLELVWASGSGAGAGEARVADAQHRLKQAAQGRDYVLVSSAGAERAVMAADGRREVLLVVRAEADSITSAYALVKRLAYESPACRFRVVVNRADSERAARRVFEPLARVAERYLQVGLDMLGFVPQDAALAHATRRSACVVDLSPAAPASRALQRMAETLRGTGEAPAGEQRGRNGAVMTRRQPLEA